MLKKKLKQNSKANKYIKLIHELDTISMFRK